MYDNKLVDVSGMILCTCNVIQNKKKPALLGLLKESFCVCDTQKNYICWYPVLGKLERQNYVFSKTYIGIIHLTMY
jgi:hypothetical protein